MLFLLRFFFTHMRYFLVSWCVTPLVVRTTTLMRAVPLLGSRLTRTLMLGLSPNDFCLTLFTRLPLTKIVARLTRLPPG